MWGKWLAITRTKNPLIWNITNYGTVHGSTNALLALGREDAA